MLLQGDPGAQVFVNFDQIFFCAGAEVLGLGDFGDFFQCVFVQPYAHRHALGFEHHTFGRAQPDGVDPHAQIGRDAGHLHHVRAEVALPIAQQDDDRRGIGAGFGFHLCLGLSRWGLPRHGQGCACVGRAGSPLTVNEFRYIQAGSRQQGGQRHHDAAAQGGAALQGEPVDGFEQIVSAVGGPLHHGR